MFRFQSDQPQESVEEETVYTEADWKTQNCSYFMKEGRKEWKEGPRLSIKAEKKSEYNQITK